MNEKESGAEAGGVKRHKNVIIKERRKKIIYTK